MQSDLIAEILIRHHQQRFIQESPYTDYLNIINARDSVLERFQSEFHDPEHLSEATFRDFLAFEHNRHWTGLQRPSKHVCDDMPKLREAVTFLFDEGLDVAERLNVLTTDEKLSVPGMAIGILTPLLLVRYPHQYGVWNGKSEAALKVLGIWPHFDRGTSKGARYARLNEMFREFSSRLEIDLWCLDGLWHVINEKSKLETNAAFLQVEQDEKAYLEGRRVQTSGYRNERNIKARNDCIKFQGLDCKICGFNFFKIYGETGLGYIHVHHVEDLAHASENQKVDPRQDLIPVCPNCHAMLHKGVKEARSVNELKAIMQVAAKHRNS